MCNLRIWLAALLLCLSTFTLPVSAEESISPEQVQAQIKESALRLEIRQRINKIMAEVIEEEAKLKQLRIDRKAVTDPSLLREYDQQIDASRQHIAQQKDLFAKLLTGGATVDDLKEPRKIEFDWKKDLMLVIQPFFKELSSLTEDARLEEALKNDLLHANFQLERIEKAIKNLEELKALEFDDIISKRILGTEASLYALQAARQNEVEVLTIQLSDINTQDVSYTDSIIDGFLNFVTKQGLHFVITITVTALVFFFFYFMSLIPQRLYKITEGEKKFTHRFWTMMCRSAAVLMSAIAFVICLYVLKEWLLFGVVLLLYIAIALSLKNSLPKYFNESRTMLNMGPIKEGERIVMNGIPWKIKKLSILTELVNPALDAKLMVPISHLMDYYSRSYQLAEGWFPTNKGDYVLLQDGRFAKVERQNLEYVELSSLGGSTSIIATTDFPGQIMKNLSTGWGIAISFGLDYNLQANITENIPQTIEAGVKAALQTSDFCNDYVELLSEFDEAAASSLNIKVVITMKGKSAGQYFALQRWMQRTLVDLCNQHAWNIPFNQMTVHMENN